MATLQPGARLGPYVVEAMIGGGGMGHIYSVRSTRAADSDKLFAAKIPRLESLSDGRRQNWLARFAREAESLVKLEHRAIIKVLHVEPRDPNPFFVMELFDGLTAQEWGARENAGLREWLHVMREIADALGVSHAAGVLHRDIKSANILIRGGKTGSFRGRVRLIDWGLVKDAAGPSLTFADEIVGTPGAIDPAVLRGAAAFSAQSDLYALGAFAYRSILGTPHLGQQRNVESQVAANQQNKWAPPSQIDATIPPEIERLLLGLLDSDPERRPRLAKAVAGRLGLLIEQVEEAQQDGARVPRRAAFVNAVTQPSLPRERCVVSEQPPAFVSERLATRTRKFCFQIVDDVMITVCPRTAFLLTSGTKACARSRTSKMLTLFCNAELIFRRCRRRRPSSAICSKNAAWRLSKIGRWRSSRNPPS